MYNVSDSVITNPAFLELMQKMASEPGTLYPAVFSFSVMWLAYCFVKALSNPEGGGEDNLVNRCFRF